MADFRPDGCSILHPLSCRPNLHDCPVQRAVRNLAEPPVLGRAVVEVDNLGGLRAIRPATDEDIEKPPDVDAVLHALRAVDTVSRVRSLLRRELQRSSGGPVMVDASRILAEIEQQPEPRR